MLTLLTALAATLVAHAIPTPTGYPNKGTLQGSQNLYALIKANSATLQSVSPPEFQYGTAQMAAALLDIGAWGQALQNQPVWVGDISLRQGGQLARHITHQRGLDADIAYLVRKHKLTGHRAKRFHDRFTEQFGRLKPDPTTPAPPLADNFDLEWNYQLFARLLKTHDVASIYLGCDIYDAMEAYDKKQPTSIMERIYAERGHEDHFHVRLRCPQGVPDCSNEWWKDPNRRPKRHAKPLQPYKDGKFREC